MQANDERAQAAAATEALDTESVQRTQLEKELCDAQARAAAAERRAERTDMQLMEYRNLQNASGLAIPDSESDEGDTGGLRVKISGFA